MGFRSTFFVLAGLLAVGCTKNIRLTSDGNKSQSSNRGEDSAALSGNGTGYSGKIIYTEKLAVGLCEDQASNIQTQIDVQAVDGVAQTATLVRSGCQPVADVNLQIGTDVTFDRNLSTATYMKSDLSAEGGLPVPPRQQSPEPGAILVCYGVSMQSGTSRDVIFSVVHQPSNPSGGNYRAYVNVKGYTNWTGSFAASSRGDGTYSINDSAQSAQGIFGGNSFWIMANMVNQSTGQLERIVESGNCSP